MKTLETQFVSGEGGYSAEPLTYKQIARKQNFAVYERSRNNIVKDYETIIIKTLKAGTQIFKQILAEDEERYPSTSQWGHYAWSFNNRQAALNKLNQLFQNKNTPVEPKTTIQALTPTIKKSKGRPKTQRPNLVFPTHQDGFTMKQLLAINSQWTQPLAYIEIKKLSTTGSIIEIKRTKSSSGRGRAAITYQKIQ